MFNISDCVEADVGRMVLGDDLWRTLADRTRSFERCGKRFAPEPKCEVRTCRGHGFGLFATDRFVACEWVTSYPADGITVYPLRRNEFGIHLKQFKNMSQDVFAHYTVGALVNFRGCDVVITGV